MKRKLKIILIVAIMEYMTVSLAYFIGSAKDAINQKETIKYIEVVPNGYIDTTTEEFYNNYVDMRQVTDYTATADGLQLYLEDGNGYYWER